MKPLTSVSRRRFLKLAALTAAGFAGRRSASAEQAASTSPNLLFILTDQQRWDAMSCAGNTVLETPNLDRLAAGGAFFQNAMSSCPVCVPARAVMLTGHSTQNTGILGNSDYKKGAVVPYSSFDNILSGHGYQSEYYGKWHCPYHLASTYGNSVRLTGMRAPEGSLTEAAAYRAFVNANVPKQPLQSGEVLETGTLYPYRPDPIDPRYGTRPEDTPSRRNGKPEVGQDTQYGQTKIPAEYSRTAFTAKETLEALERLKDGPFSLTCSIDPPHPPMVVSEAYHGKYPAGDMPIPDSINDTMENSPYARRAKTMPDYIDRETIGYMTSNYYGLVKEIDDWVGKILDKLALLGLEDNTLVIFTSDHGEMLGAHGMKSKMTFYEESVHVPLIMRLPTRIRPGSVVSTPVSHIDFFATILDYLEIPSQPSDGRSLRPLIEGRESGAPDYAISEWKGRSVPNFMVRTEDWKLMIANQRKSRSLDALYHLKEDPQERNNLIGENPNKAQYSAQAQAMKNRVIEWLRKTDSPHLEEVIAREL